MQDNLRARLEGLVLKFGKGAIPPGTLAAAIKEISRREIKTGGPYADLDGKADYGLNKAISAFLASRGVRLPDLEGFLAVERIISRLSGEFPFFPEDIQQECGTVLRKTAAGNEDGQMLLLPHFFFSSLKKPGMAINDGWLDELGLMSGLFWSAFIIYDDFWDADEAAEPRLLPIANAFSEHFHGYFSRHFSTRLDYASLCRELSDRSDAAAFKEITACRFDKDEAGFSQADSLPADKMQEIKFFPCAGHIFAPLAIMAELGYRADSPETASVISFFRNYLLARQLSDDMHDFEEDWNRGQASLAVSELIKDLEGNENAAQRRAIFWTKTIDRLCAESRNLSEAALADLERSGIFRPGSKLASLCHDLEIAAQRAQRERDRNMSFAKLLTAS